MTLRRAGRGWSRACRAMQSASYEEVVPACSEEVRSAGAHRLEATLLRGTLHQLTGQNQAAREDYTAVIEDNASSSKVGEPATGLGGLLG